MVSETMQVDEPIVESAGSHMKHLEKGNQILRTFPPTLGSLRKDTEKIEHARDMTVNVLNLEDDEIQIFAAGVGHVEFAPEASNGEAQPLRKGSLQRRGQSFPAASLPENLDFLINDSSLTSPDFRDTFTPDVHRNTWQGSANPSLSPPARSRITATRSTQLAAVSATRSTQTAAGTAGKRWDWIRSGLQEPALAGTDAASHSSHPLKTKLKRRKSELRNTQQIDQGIKQALYDHWGSAKKEKCEFMDDIIDLEELVVKNVQKFIVGAKRLLGQREHQRADGKIGGDLAVKAGWVESKRKGLWGSRSRTVFTQLLIDGSFVMRKTEQTNSPIICNMHVSDIDVEQDSSCDCTINLVPHVSRDLRSLQPGTGRGWARTRMVSFTVSDPVSKQKWLSAFEMRKSIVEEQAQGKSSVTNLVSQLKLASKCAKEQYPVETHPQH